MTQLTPVWIDGQSHGGVEGVGSALILL